MTLPSSSLPRQTLTIEQIAFSRDVWLLFHGPFVFLNGSRVDVLIPFVKDHEIGWRTGLPPTPDAPLEPLKARHEIRVEGLEEGRDKIRLNSKWLLTLPVYVEPNLDSPNLHALLRVPRPSEFWSGRSRRLSAEERYTITCNANTYPAIQQTRAQDQRSSRLQLLRYVNLGAPRGSEVIVHFHIEPKKAEIKNPYHDLQMINSLFADLVIEPPSLPPEHLEPTTVQINYRHKEPQPRHGPAIDNRHLWSLYEISAGGTESTHCDSFAAQC